MEGQPRQQSSDIDINQTDSYGPYNNCLIENSHKHLPIVENELKFKKTTINMFELKFKPPKHKIQC